MLRLFQRVHNYSEKGAERIPCGSRRSDHEKNTGQTVEYQGKRPARMDFVFGVYPLLGDYSL